MNQKTGFSIRNPIHKPKRKRRHRFAQMRILNQLAREVRDNKKYGMTEDDRRFRRVGNRRLYEFVLPEGSRIVNGVVFQAVDGHVECLGNVNEFMGDLGR